MIRCVVARGFVAALLIGSCTSFVEQSLAQEKPAAAKRPVAPLELAAPAAPPAKINDTDFTAFGAEDLYVLSRTAAQEKHYPVAAIAQYWYMRKTQEGRYDLACYLARDGNVDAAFYWLQIAALDEGVDVREATHDPDLASLVKDERWPKVKAYLDECSTYFATTPITRTVIVVPKGYKIATPITTVVWLHGYLSGPDDFVNAAAQQFADKMNVALIGISATNSRGPRSFSWAVNIDEDYKRVEAGLNEAGERVTIAKGQLIAMGFSQGGQLAVEIAARHPDEFAGAIALSAGSRSQLEGLKPSELLKKRGFVVSVNGGENPGSVKLTAHDAAWLRAADAKLIHKVYSDVTTHSIPADFEERFPEWVKFVLDAGK